MASELLELASARHVPKAYQAIVASHGQQAAIGRKLDNLRSVVARQGVPHFAGRRVPDEHPRILKTHGGQRLAVWREGDAQDLARAGRSALGPLVDLVLVPIELLMYGCRGCIQQKERAAATLAGQQLSIRRALKVAQPAFDREALDFLAAGNVP